jgi:hypothetical protein
MIENRFEKARIKAKKLYKKEYKIFCPFFNKNINLNSDGFHHLQFKGNQQERTRKEQFLKFSLLPLALNIIKRSGTLQEYRKTMVIAQKGRYSNKKSSKMKLVEYWGFTSIISEPKIRIKVILRRLGDGQVVFWSVMPDIKLGGINQWAKLYSTDMEDD